MRLALQAPRPRALMVVFLLAHMACNASSQPGGESAEETTPTATSGGSAQSDDPSSTSPLASQMPLSRLIGGAAQEPNAYWPPTGQICEVELGGGTALAKPPQALLDSCAACHGPTGDGKNGIPGIKRALSYADFSALVRAGVRGNSGEMSAYPGSWLNEPDLKRIYAYAAGAPLKETGVCKPQVPMDPTAFAQVYAAGLAKWRQQDGHVDPNGVKSNVACAQCHAADPLDIAYYGFVDGDILRRGNQHLPIAEVAPLVEMVHALRDKYNIGRRDPLMARPFQPCGALLDGQSIAARDAAFGAQLQDMNLLIATSPITSVAEAEAAYAQLANIDLHMLRIPIPFNRYSEDINHNVDNKPIDCDADVDNCDDHGSIADWMPSSPHIIQNKNDWQKGVDAYLANPTLETFSGYQRGRKAWAFRPGMDSPWASAHSACRVV